MARDILHSDVSSTARSQHSLRTLAEDIAIERGECVAEAFFHMAAVRSLHPELRAAIVTCRGATVQDQQATDGAQAAHLLPGQILIGAQPIWALADGAAPGGLSARELGRLSPRLQMCFAKTNSVPAHFNRADSQAERMAAAAGAGLKRLFADAVSSMWEHARVDAGRPLVVDRDNAVHAMGLWFSSLNGVYRAAERQKRAAAARERDAAARERRSDEADVLAAYADSFQVAAEPTRFVRRHLSWIDQVYRWL